MVTPVRFGRPGRNAQKGETLGRRNAQKHPPAGKAPRRFTPVMANAALLIIDSGSVEGQLRVSRPTKRTEADEEAGCPPPSRPRPHCQGQGTRAGGRKKQERGRDGRAHARALTTSSPAQLSSLCLGLVGVSPLAAASLLL